MNETALSSRSPLVSLRGISKAFPGVQALDNVSFDVLPGETHVLMGENGAGKSTLMKILSGAYQPDAGTIEIGGRPVRITDPVSGQAQGIAMIYQELTVLENLDVGRNIMLGQEPTRFGQIQWKQLYSEAARVLADLHLDIDPRTPLFSLAISRRQMVEIARAARRSPQIIVMDEPTSSLTQSEEETLFALIARLKQKGVGIVYISHRMVEVFRLADRITVLRDGRHIDTRAAADYTQAQLIEQMVGRAVDSLAAEQSGSTGSIALEARGLTLGGRVRDASLRLCAGEIVGLAGLVGAGRTELAEMLFGALRPASGEILVDGRLARFRSPADAIAAGIAYVPEDRKGLGLVLAMDVQTNMILSLLDRVTRGGVLKGAKIRETVAEWTRRLNVRAASPRVNIEGLSGGNQQKVVIAKWLARQPRVLILNEPTRGIDVGAKNEVHLLIREIARQGVAVLMISSELPEILAISHRVVVMAQGEITGELPASAATEQSVLALAFGKGA
jgi:rhamnose transport system ATP-binding protein